MGIIIPGIPPPHIVLLLVRAPFLPISGNIWWFTQPVAGVLVIRGGGGERAVAIFFLLERHSYQFQATFGGLDNQWPEFW